MTSPEAISITRLTDGIYVEINDGFERITGYRAAEVVGRRAVEVGIWADTADRDRMVAALQATGRLIDEMTASPPRPAPSRRRPSAPRPRPRSCS